MHAPSDPFARHRSSLSRLARALSGLVLMVALGSAGAIAVEPKTATQPNWPCRQIMVPRVSLATVWSGPAIESSNWRSDQAVADLVARLAARRTPLDEAEHAIEDFAKTGSAAKKAKLVAVFAGLFETLNDERAQVMEGLLRFGAKQKELAEKIRAENAQIHQGPAAPPADRSRPTGQIAAQDLEWDLRIFDERQKSLTYVCESPTLIEQRLFALARIIERNLD